MEPVPCQEDIQMTRSKMWEHCFKMLFAAEFYPAQEVEQQTRQYFDSPDEDDITAEGETENILVISVVGRFLEHSRIYIFGYGEEAQYYIGSADIMTRYTVKRVEVAAPVYSERLKKRLQDFFDLMLSDNKKARKEDAKGAYSVVECKGQPINSQELLYQEAYAKAAVNSSNQLEAAVQQTENKVIE